MLYIFPFLFFPQVYFSRLNNYSTIREEVHARFSFLLRFPISVSVFISSFLYLFNFFHASMKKESAFVFP